MPRRTVYHKKVGGVVSLRHRFTNYLSVLMSETRPIRSPCHSSGPCVIYSSGDTFEICHRLGFSLVQQAKLSVQGSYPTFFFSYSNMAVGALKM